MFQYSLSEIAEITHSTCEGNGNLRITKVQTDSRTSFDEISAIFMAIKGARGNGHDYIVDMYERGCRNFWVQIGENYPHYSDCKYKFYCRLSYFILYEKKYFNVANVCVEKFPLLFL